MSLDSEHISQITHQLISEQQIMAWLQHAITLAESVDLRSIAGNLNALEHRLKKPGFCLAVVGEFNRGKSTLINRLLDRSVVPVGVLPTTTTVTSIINGSQEEMLIDFPDGRHEKRSIAEASWAGLVATSGENKIPEIFPHVRLIINHPWLRQLDAEIIDTPGVNDANGNRSALASDVLSMSDAAVLLIGAMSPASGTEAIFLEQEVMGRHIPRVAVVISMLDRIPAEQQQMVVDNICEKIQVISPLIPIVTAHPLDSHTTITEALEKVRTQIEALATKAERKVWRSRQIAALTSDYAQQLEEAGRIALATIQMDATTRAAAVLRAREEAEIAALQWENVYRELNHRRSDVEEEVRQRLYQSRERFLESVLVDLPEREDLEAWWRQEFPSRLRQEFLRLAQNAEAYMTDALARDIQWLQEKVAPFGIALGNLSRQSDSPIEIIPAQQEVPLSNIEQDIQLTRIGSSAASVVGYLLFGPVGAAVSIGVGIVRERFLWAKLKEQQEQLKTEARISFDRSIEKYVSLVSERLSSLYEQVARDIRQQQVVWETSKARVLEVDDTPLDEQKWQALIDAAANLQHEIQASLAKH